MRMTVGAIIGVSPHRVSTNAAGAPLVYLLDLHDDDASQQG